MEHSASYTLNLKLLNRRNQLKLSNILGKIPNPNIDVFQE